MLGRSSDGRDKMWAHSGTDAEGAPKYTRAALHSKCAKPLCPRPACSNRRLHLLAIQAPKRPRRRRLSCPAASWIVASGALITDKGRRPRRHRLPRAVSDEPALSAAYGLTAFRDVCSASIRSDPIRSTGRQAAYSVVLQSALSSAGQNFGRALY